MRAHVCAAALVVAAASVHSAVASRHYYNLTNNSYHLNNNTILTGMCSGNSDPRENIGCPQDFTARPAGTRGSDIVTCCILTDGCTVNGSICANGTRICHNVTNVMECLDPLDLRLVAHTCPVELAACKASDWGLGNTTTLSARPSTRTTACGQRLPDLVAQHLGNKGSPVVQWWRESDAVQAVYICAYRMTTQPRICTDTQIVGALSRPILRRYCQPEIDAGSYRCAAMEHHHCCSCHSPRFPVLPDNGHCCADCQMCIGRPSVLPPGDRCAGVPTRKCDPMHLIDAVSAVIDAGGPATNLDLGIFCSCRSVLITKKRARQKIIRTEKCQVPTSFPDLSGAEQMCPAAFGACRLSASCMSEVGAAFTSQTVPTSGSNATMQLMHCFLGQRYASRGIPCPSKFATCMMDAGCANVVLPNRTESARGELGPSPGLHSNSAWKWNTELTNVCHANPICSNWLYCQLTASAAGSGSTDGSWSGGSGGSLSSANGR